MEDIHGIRFFPASSKVLYHTSGRIAKTGEPGKKLEKHIKPKAVNNTIHHASNRVGLERTTNRASAEWLDLLRDLLLHPVGSDRLTHPVKLGRQPWRQYSNRQQHKAPAMQMP